MVFKSGYVALVGRPNAGKSTLLNVLLEEVLSIVTHKPQTTRHRITGIVNHDDAQIIFLDTPGIHESTKALNVAMNQVIDRVLEDADIICLLIPANSREFNFSSTLLKQLAGKRCIAVMTKSDLIQMNQYEAIATRIRAKLSIDEIIFISAQKKNGLDILFNSIKSHLPEGPKYFPEDVYTEQSTRFIVSELIREQVFLQLGQEIPYSCAVSIEMYEDPKHDSDLTRIHAAIVVERTSQKSMVIGKKGSRIKKIGERSREKIQDLIQGKVFLKLFVKVEKNWTKDDRQINDLGFSDQVN